MKLLIIWNKKFVWFFVFEGGGWMGGGGGGIRVLRQTYGKDQLGNSNKNTIQNRSFTTQHQAVNSATLRDIPNIFLPLELHEVEFKIKSSIKIFHQFYH